MRYSRIIAVGSVLLTVLLIGCNAQQSGEEVLTPTQTPVPQSASVSGILNISGSVVQNTTALMLQRVVGETTYREFDRIPATNGAEWIFDGAQSGEVYEITTALQVNEENAATSNVVTTEAPSSGNELIVNTNLNLSTPGTAPRVDCGEVDGASGYNATIKLSSIEGAQGYYYQVGSKPGQDDTASDSIVPSNDSGRDLETTVYLRQDTEAFVRYAYTLCTDCNVYDTQNWSAWSPTTGFTCPQ